MQNINTKLIAKIETPRLILKPIELSDANSYYEAERASIKELNQYWSWVKPGKSINDIEEFINSVLVCHTKPNLEQMFFSLFEKTDNRFLGIIWIIRINWFVPWFEIAYWLDTRETGNGYMTEAVNALSRACFVIYKAKRIEIKTFLDNDQSQAIPKRLGFTMEAEVKNYFVNFARNEITDGLAYACCNINSLPPLKIDIKE